MRFHLPHVPQSDHTVPGLLRIHQLSYTNGDTALTLQPLKGQIDTTKSDYSVGKVKVEVRLVKVAQGRWGALEGDQPDRMP